MKELLLLSLTISMATLGFRAITGKGMILYFLRKPFDTLNERKKELIESMQAHREEAIEHSLIRDEFVKYSDEWIKHEDDVLKCMSVVGRCDKANPNKYDWLLYIMKPFILCSTCMASVHTIVWFLVLGINFDKRLILVMLVVALLNTLTWSLIEMVQKITVKQEL